MRIGIDYKKYLRLDKFPHIWCVGCGNGTVMKAVIKAIDNLQLDKNEVVIVSGIGCSSRATGYLDFNTLHTTHGRALPFATGVKFSKPRLKVIVISGDGDCMAIGGNHFMHACRRNIDMTLVMINNGIYGMTGGQYSPATNYMEYGTTAPYGNIEQDSDNTAIAMACGASYVARSTTYHVAQLEKLITDGIQHKGFSVIEAIAQCPHHYGRKNKKGDGPAMVRQYKENAVPFSRAQNMSEEELKGKIVTGKFLQKESPEYCESYARLVLRAQGKEE
ncbi:MAG: 2-oxoacid:ferredoxin oxidoreductase subunit beta [Candidatus Wallbacteria bacterium HGW-Wallbacteria-1]|jgi:2-oxoglutarate ferredoxin oxidoreductase subunit beta|uniref:2-oxoacid:ferredoxin oxidoreductase subunit beta n=1 Tax=Candidatus Wallbacteria bacterium HGW-Wallbacteria-1 TaxID=2013854 RepID=A0A2N1PIK5_9BACT|nr:MAG: 2-oxoacid:ferredoxin oxidoreductase subunit beta [Candidatus Wallbacteria bacterium HGW-Wallbacteria-1]